MALNNVEFLRSLIDFLAQQEKNLADQAPIEVEVEPEHVEIQPDEQAPKIIVINTPAPAAGTAPGIEPVEDTPLDRDDIFIPPLQAKLEVMKKLAGIEPKNQELTDLHNDDLLGD